MKHEKVYSLKSANTLTLVAMLAALSVVGSLIKVFNTVAFDSLPGYFAALYLGGGYGAVIMSVGHMLTAATSGFPLSLPVYLIIAVVMAACAYIYSLAYRKVNVYAAVVAGTVLNGPVATLLLVPVFGWGFFVQWVLPLTAASFANVLLAALVYKAIGSMLR